MLQAWRTSFCFSHSSLQNLSSSIRLGQEHRWPALPGPLKDIHRVLREPFLYYDGCALRLVLSEDEPSPSPKSRVLWSRLSRCLCRISLYTAALIFPSTRTDLCLDTTPVSVFRKFLGFHSFLCALTCTVDYEALCWLLCAFPNHVQSAEFTTGGHGSSCRNIWQMISGNKMHLTSILSNILAWISSKPFSFCLYGTL